MSDKWVVNSEHTKEQFLAHAAKMFDEHKYVTFSYTTGKQRTQKQNAAMWKYMTMLADKLNDAGHDMRSMLHEGIEIPWNKDTVREYLWGPIQKAVTGHKSSTKPTREQYTMIYEVLNRHTASRKGVSVPWPCKELLNDRAA